MPCSSFGRSISELMWVVLAPPMSASPLLDGFLSQARGLIPSEEKLGLFAVPLGRWEPCSKPRLKDWKTSGVTVYEFPCSLMNPWSPVDTAPAEKLRPDAENASEKSNLGSCLAPAVANGPVRASFTVT